MINENDDIKSIIAAYDRLIKNIEEEAIHSEDGRAYGGIVRAGKGKLVENIAKILVKLAWNRLNQDEERLKILGKKLRYQ